MNSDILPHIDAVHIEKRSFSSIVVMLFLEKMLANLSLPCKAITAKMIL